MMDPKMHPATAIGDPNDRDVDYGVATCARWSARSVRGAEVEITSISTALRAAGSKPGRKVARRRSAEGGLAV
jgi:hypothetical protein